MSFDTPDDPHSRDATLARLLAEALKSQSKAAGHAKLSECPDAEVIATYAEHGLAEEETARWETHFADCDRCRKIIAVLAASAEELSRAEVENLGSLAAASSSPAREPIVVGNAATRWMSIWRRPTVWRWLVPAVGMASVAALWLALRQTRPGETTDSRRIVATTAAPQNGIGQGDTATPSAKPDEMQMAQANVPPPPAAPPPGALQRDKETTRANPSAATRQEPLRKQETFRSAAQAPQVSEADGGQEAREDVAKDNRVPSAQAAEQKSKVADALNTAAPAAPAAQPSPPPPPPNRGRPAQQDLNAAAGAPAPAQLKALAQPASLAIVFASPDRSALWRLGPGGRIEHSADQGQTWQAQSSGVTADLLAGAAPSEKVAWAVGRLGSIVRTEDGEHWQRVVLPFTVQTAPPAGPTPDWIGVEARDALHATITSQDSRRFATEDGGRTWAQLP
jgi:hypothetical protein